MLFVTVAKRIQWSNGYTGQTDIPPAFSTKLAEQTLPLLESLSVRSLVNWDTTVARCE